MEQNTTTTEQIPTTMERAAAELEQTTATMEQNTPEKQTTATSEKEDLGLTTLRYETHAITKEYLESHPDPEDEVSNVPLRSLIENLRQALYDNNSQMLSRILKAVKYQLDDMKLADRYVAFLKLSGPENKLCAEWDCSSMWHLWDPIDERYDKIWCYITTQTCGELFPLQESLKRMHGYDRGGASLPEPKFGYDKGAKFLIAALFFSGWEMNEIRDKMGQLREALKADSAQFGRAERDDPHVPLNTDELLALQVRAWKLIDMYNESHPGLSEASPNLFLHGQLEDLHSGCLYVSEATLMRVLPEVEHRLHDMEVGNKYVSFLGLSGPNGYTCQQLEAPSLYTLKPNEERGDRSRWYDLWKLIINRTNYALFPEGPIKLTPSKGRAFLLAALFLSDWDFDRIEAEIERLRKAFRDEIERNARLAFERRGAWIRDDDF